MRVLNKRHPTDKQMATPAMVDFFLWLAERLMSCEVALSLIVPAPKEFDSDGTSLRFAVDIGNPHIPVCIHHISLAQPVRFVGRRNQNFESQPARRRFRLVRVATMQAQ